MPPTSENKQTKAPEITPELLALVEALRKPVKTDKEIAAERAQEQERADMRSIEKQRQANRAAEQNSCSHEHETGVGTPVVYVASLNRLYCQHCHAWIFSNPQEAAFYASNIAPEKHPMLWNRHFGRAMASGLL